MQGRVFSAVPPWFAPRRPAGTRRGLPRMSRCAGRPCLVRRAVAGGSAGCSGRSAVVLAVPTLSRRRLSVKSAMHTGFPSSLEAMGCQVAQAMRMPDGLRAREHCTCVELAARPFMPAVCRERGVAPPRHVPLGPDHPQVRNPRYTSTVPYCAAARPRRPHGCRGDVRAHDTLVTRSASTPILQSAGLAGMRLPAGSASACALAAVASGAGMADAGRTSGERPVQPAACGSGGVPGAALDP